MCRLQALILCALLAFVVTLSGCNKSASTQSGGQSSTVGINSLSLTTINLSADYISIPKGLTDQFYATGSYSNGTSAPLPSGLTWTTSDGNILTVDSKTGLATAVGVGLGTIYAEDLVSKAQGKLSVTVTDAVLNSLSVNPPNNTCSSALPVGFTLQMTATGYYSDGSPSINLTTQTQVAWHSDNTAIATVDAKGLVTAISDGGPVIISASFPISLSQFLSGTAQVTVSQATLQSVTVAPAPGNSAKIAAGQTTQLAVTGTASGGCTADLTSRVTSWSSSDTSVATVSPTGLVTGQSVTANTNVIITAAYTDPSGKTFTGTSTITVTPAVVKSVTVSVAPATVTSITVTSTEVIVGQTTQLTALGTYSDGYKAPLASCDPTIPSNSCVTWTSSDNSVAFVINGLVTMHSASTDPVTITATYSDPSVTPAVFTVSSANLTGVKVRLGSCDLADLANCATAGSVAAGQSITLEAIGTYDNLGTAVLSENIFWSTSDYTIAKVNDGVVTGQSASTVPVTITATYTDPSGTTFTGSFVVTVTQAVLTNVSVSVAGCNPATTASCNSPTITIVPGVTPQPTVQLTAYGTYSAGPPSALNSADVTWSTDNSSVASVDQYGLVTGGSAGTVHISGASTDPTTGKTYTGTATVTVNQLSLIGVTVSPSSATIIGGQTIQLTAYGTYSAGPPLALNSTDVIAWSSDASGVASVSQSGQVTGGSSAGTAHISAKYGEYSGTATVTVTISDSTNVSLASISISPSRAVMTVGSSLQLSAIGLNSDGTPAVLPSGLVWSSSIPRKAHVQNGLVTAYLPGDVVITVTDPSTGISGSAIVKVRPNPEREGRGHGDGNGQGADPK